MNSRWLLTTCVGLGFVGTTFAITRADEHEDHTEQKVEFAKALRPSRKPSPMKPRARRSTLSARKITRERHAMRRM